MLATAQQTASALHPDHMTVILTNATPYEQQLARETILRCVRRWGAVRVRAGSRSLDLHRGAPPASACGCGARGEAFLAAARHGHCLTCRLGDLLSGAPATRWLHVEPLPDPNPARRTAPAAASPASDGARRRAASGTASSVI